MSKPFFAYIEMISRNGSFAIALVNVTQKGADVLAWDDGFAQEELPAANLLDAVKHYQQF